MSDVSVPSFSTSVNESEDSFSNQSEVIVKPMYTKNVKDVKVKSMSQYETLFTDFYFLSANEVWVCKIYTSFSQGHSGSRGFIDKPVNLGDHPTERLTDHFKSKRHLPG